MGLFSIFLLFSFSFVFCENNIGYFWQLTDPHIDLWYKEGSEANCSIPHTDICCGSMNGNGNNDTISVPAGKFGTPNAFCDIPAITFEETLKFVTSQPFKTDAILFTGDLIGHRYVLTNEQAISTFQVAFDLLKKYFPQKDSFGPILTNLGNHDANPVDQLAPFPNGSWLLIPFGVDESSWIPSKEKDIEYEGYFSIDDFSPTLSIITLNTQWVNGNNHLIDNYTSPKHEEMTNWFISELEKAKRDGKRVILTGHTPPSGDWVRIFPQWNTDFLNIVKKYHEIIAFQLWGHLHADIFSIQRDDEGNPIHVGLLSPPITTFRYRNPSVRLITYDKVSGELLDIQTFMNDIDQSNIDGTMEGNWKLEYSMKGYWGLPDFSGRSFDDLLQSFEQNQTKFLDYMSFYNTRRKGDPCDRDCQHQLLCQLKFTDKTLFNNCVTEKTGKRVANEKEKEFIPYGYF